MRVGGWVLGSVDQLLKKWATQRLGGPTAIEEEISRRCHNSLNVIAQCDRRICVMLARSE